MSGHFYAVNPHKTRSSANAENWVFGHYMEFPSQREDQQWYDVFLFRDVARKTFGASEFLGANRPNMPVRDWATKVVLDSEFRERFQTTNSELVSLWKRR